MKDIDCVAFLQWALPRLNLRWPGFRRVRGQVCKRIDRRIQALGLSGRDAYIAYLADKPGEWDILDSLCYISISRFYRDRAVFDCLGDTVLPELAEQAGRRTNGLVRCWSAGCASGEEPYTLNLVWEQRVSPRFPQTGLAILATDIDEHLLERARIGCYPASALKELPRAWIERAFSRNDGAYCLRDEWRGRVEFRWQDIRAEHPPGEFDLILCRNLAFTYFDKQLQLLTLERLTERVRADGFLVIGRHESLPSSECLSPLAASLGIYRKTQPFPPFGGEGACLSAV